MLAFHCLLSSCWPQALGHVIKRLLVAFYSKGMLIMMMAEVERGWGWGVGAKAEFALRPCGMGKGCYVLMTLTFELLRLLDTAAAGWLHTRPGVSLKYALSDRGVAATLPSKSLLSSVEASLGPRWVTDTDCTGSTGQSQHLVWDDTPLRPVDGPCPPPAWSSTVLHGPPRRIHAWGTHHNPTVTATITTTTTTFSFSSLQSLYPPPYPPLWNMYPRHKENTYIKHTAWA